MKNFVLMLVVVLLSAGTLIPSRAMAIEASGDTYVGVYSAYVWRGDNLSEDDTFVVQPGADVSIGGFTVSWWGNLSENTGELNEVDLTLDYTLNVTDKVSVRAGNILYEVSGFKTNELYLGVAVDTLLSPTLTIYKDYDNIESLYATLGGSYGFDLQKGLSIGFGATIGAFLDQGELGSEDAFLNNLEVSASADYALTDQVTIGALVLVSTPLSDDAENEGYTIDDEVTAGVSATFAF
jgi:hypothetical protein